tara:strand:+ start:1398 stop:3305 length:1908 start_codon:yes stop_codon:yes gene_type:complete
MKRTLGTCYYPEHLDETIWNPDAQRMAELGLSWVRIGEFAWSRIEPKEGQFDWDWLDRAIETLGSRGLKVILGTPTTTPPIWVTQKYPDMLALDSEGRPRGFGSRRHYCFSHDGYKEQCRDIVTRLAERYGENPHIQAWQTDNEYGCHDTTVSYSKSAEKAFQAWLKDKYGNHLDALNTAWGNVFWSMEYGSYEEIALPHLTVTNANPAHWLEFRRFSSDQVVKFNRLQVDIIKHYSKAPIVHNYMGRITDFDHFKVGADLDIASWDSYPLGFLMDRCCATDTEKRTYMRQGDPDFQAFHHDLYRAVGKGRWWIMEQQPGPVNWASINPDPLPGMVRLWTWEAYAHGAENVCYFRWRQAPFAQEQMHAGLLRPDSVEAPGFFEAERVAKELSDSDDVALDTADVAILFDYDSDAAWTALPHLQGSNYFELVFQHYRALRKLGLNIDILPPDAGSLFNYKLVIAPGLITMSEELKSTLVNSGAHVIFGPRSSARQEVMQLPVPLPPNIDGLDVTVARVDCMLPDQRIPVKGGGCAISYLEILETSSSPVVETEGGQVLAVSDGNTTYLGAFLDDEALDHLYLSCCKKLEIDFEPMPEGVRRRTSLNEEFWFNYSAEQRSTPHGPVEPADLIRLQRN